MDSFTTITRAQPHRLRRERLSREHSGGPSASVQSGDSSPSDILFFIPPAWNRPQKEITATPSRTTKPMSRQSLQNRPTWTPTRRRKVPYKSVLMTRREERVVIIWRVSTSCTYSFDKSRFVYKGMLLLERTLYIYVYIQQSSKLRDQQRLYTFRCKLFVFRRFRTYNILVSFCIELHELYTHRRSYLFI